MTQLLEPTAADEAQIINPRRLAGINRRIARDRISESINGQYYWDRDGWVRYAEYRETEQGHRLVDIKGWKPIPRSPRPDINREHNQKWMAILRQEGGALHFPPAQIVSNRWHKRPPVIQVCRQELDDDDHPEHTQECFARVQFPQMEGVRVFEAICSICKRDFVSIESTAVAETLMKSHMQVSHKDHLVNKELVTGLRDALAPIVTSGSGIDMNLIAQVAAQAAAAAIAQVLGTTQHPNSEDEDPDNREPHEGAPDTSLPSEVEGEPVDLPNAEPVGEEWDPKDKLKRK